MFSSQKKEKKEKKVLVDALFVLDIVLATFCYTLPVPQTSHEALIK
jgi:hypothetical protein